MRNKVNALIAGAKVKAMEVMNKKYQFIPL